MNSEVLYRRYQSSDLEEILSLSERSDSTNRTALSWEGNHMTAICAFDGERLIGAIPFEQRSLAVGHQSCLKGLWATGVHVDEEYRSLGIGTAMDRLVPHFFGREASGTFVYRKDEASGAYRWYKKIGFDVIATIEGLDYQFSDSSTIQVSYEINPEEKGFSIVGHELYDIFCNENAERSGFRARFPEYWENVRQFHLYRSFYNYSVITMGEGDRKAYAFLGETSIGDGVHRLDVFEFVGPPASWGCLLNAIQMVALNQSIFTVRFRAYANSDIGEWLKRAGVSKKDEFFFMGKIFGDQVTLRSCGTAANFRYLEEPQERLGESVDSKQILDNFLTNGTYFHSDYV